MQIREVAERYEVAIKAFYQWFGEQQTQVHGSEFAELSRLETRCQQVMQQLEEAEASLT